jgi:hypothetical protein
MSSCETDVAPPAAPELARRAEEGEPPPSPLPPSSTLRSAEETREI